MSSLAIPARPDNFRARAGMHMLESDVFDICGRVKDLDPNLLVYALDPPVAFAGKTYNFAIQEVCADGVERLVQRFEGLDARVIEQLEYLLHVPFEKRFAEAEKLEAKAEAENREREFDHLVENIGLPMLPDLERTGFIQRPKSYAKRGVKR